MSINDVLARHTVLEHYLFKFRGEMLLCLGVGSLFNHSRTPSLDYRIDREELIIRFYAARDVRVTPLAQTIHLQSAKSSLAAWQKLQLLSCSQCFLSLQQGEELTIFYGNVWFDDTGNPGKLSSETCMHYHMDHEDTFLAALDA